MRRRDRSHRPATRALAGVDHVEDQRRVRRRSSGAAPTRLPRAVPHAGHRARPGACGGPQRHRDTVAGHARAGRRPARRSRDLEPLDRGVDVAGGAAGGRLLAEHVPRLDRACAARAARRRRRRCPSRGNRNSRNGSSQLGSKAMPCAPQVGDDLGDVGDRRSAAAGTGRAGRAPAGPAAPAAARPRTGRPARGPAAPAPAPSAGAAASRSRAARAGRAGRGRSPGCTACRCRTRRGGCCR